LKSMNLKPEQTRNGPALVFPTPVCTTYLKPWQRMLYHPGRDANPIFHIMESIWMLAGRRDVKFPEMFNSKFGQYSDDGVNFNAAYGYRWRQHFDNDQLISIINELRVNPSSRQCVLQMWDPDDLFKNTKDKACNLSALFDCRDGALNMTVFNRSNDIWWGAYGANAVHFSYLQQFVAEAIDRPMGVYRQVANNFHLYTELYPAAHYVEHPPHYESYDAYARVIKAETPYRLMRTGYLSFLGECEFFCRDPFNTDLFYNNPWFSEVAVPLAQVSKARKQGETGLVWAHAIKDDAINLAVKQWILRRENAKAEKANSA